MNQVFHKRNNGLRLVKSGERKAVELPGELHGLREASTGRIVSMLPRVWAVAEPATRPARGLALVDPDPGRGEHRTGTRIVNGGLEFYRKYTEVLLQQYLQRSMDGGRTPTLLGREVFRGAATHTTTHGFEDNVIFCVDVERCLAKLTPMQRALLKRIAVQSYTFTEASMVLGLSRRGCLVRYQEAVDHLTTLLLESGLLESLKSCQEGRPVEIRVTDWDSRA